MTKPVFTIMPDFGGAYGWHKNGDDPDWSGVGGNHADYVAWCAEPSISGELQAAFAEWQLDFEGLGRMGDEAIEHFDWLEYHQRGLALAIRLKVEMGDRAGVIYEKPFEDPCCHAEERREILIDGTVRTLPSRSKRAAMDLKHLMPEVMSWVEQEAGRGMLHGRFLDDAERKIAVSVGVQHPEDIRLVVGHCLTPPTHPELARLAAHFEMLGKRTEGLTLGYTILISAQTLSTQLFAHECRHVAQFERYSELGVFVEDYLFQIIGFGYRDAPLEIDARQHAQKF